MDIKDNKTVLKNNTDMENKEKTKKRKKRCYNCNKKIGMIEFKCKCSDVNIFCSNCRHPKINDNDEKGHVCNFDFKQHGREILEKNNPKIEHSKINGI